MTGRLRLQVKGECKMVLTFKDGEVIHRHQVTLKGGQAEDESVRSWPVCVHPTYQLDGSDNLSSPGARGLINGVAGGAAAMAGGMAGMVGLGELVGRGSVNSNTSQEGELLLGSIKHRNVVDIF